MKKLAKLLSVLFLITFAFAGCSSSDETNAKTIAGQFVKKLYTIDSKQIDEFKHDTPANNNIVKVQQILQPIMTDNAFGGIIGERAYYFNVNIKSDSTMEIENLTLTKRFYDSKENKAGYDYKAKFKLISNKDKKEQTDVLEGYVGLVKEKDKWKVYAYKLYDLPKLLR